MLKFLSKYVYKMQLYLKPFYNILRQQNNFEWTTEHQTRFEEIKKLLKERILKTIPDPIQPFYAMCDASKLDCQNNHYEVDLLGTSTFKPIPYSQWIKNNTQ